jgi:hypothetical protein
MSWATQALHVARKDVRFTRAALALYAVIVAAALFHALTLADATSAGAIRSLSDPLDAAMFVLVVLGVILAATAVQADSPTQSNAFWASRPFDPTAMLGAKLIYCAAVVLGIPLAAQLIGLLEYDVSASAIVAVMLKSATAYGLMLLCAVVVASLTTDLRGFIVGALVLVVGFLLAVAAAPATISRWLVNPPFGLFLVLTLLTSGALLIWLYRRRDVTRVAWLGGVIAVGAALIAIATIDSPAVESTPTAMPRAVDIRVAPTGPVQFAPGNVSEGRMRLPIRIVVAAAPPRAQLNLRVDSAVVRLRDGSRLKARPFYGFLAVDNGRGALPPDVRLYGSDAGPQIFAKTNLTFDADSAKIASVGIADLQVWTRVFVAEAVPLTTTRVGAARHRVTTNGIRLEVADTPDIPPARIPRNSAVRPTGLTISVVASRIRDVRAPNDIRNVGVAVINESRREGIVVGADSYSSSSNWMVLPGAPMNTSVIRLHTAAPDIGGSQRVAASIPGVGPVMENASAFRINPIPDADWYRDAKLVVVQWVPRGNYPLRLTTTLN